MQILILETESVIKKPNMKYFTSLVLTFLFVSVLTFGQSTPTKKPANIKTDWQFLNENSYSIQYPVDWDLDKSGRIGTSFILFSRSTSPNDNNRENVCLVIQDLQGQNINLDRFVENSLDQTKTILTNVNIIENKRMSENGQDFQKVIANLDQGIEKFKSEQYYFLKNGKVYILTFTCEIDKFEKYKETGEKIMNSFKLKERVSQETIPEEKTLLFRLIAKYGDSWGNLIYKKEYTLGMTKEMIREFSYEKFYKVSKVIRNGNTIELWEFDRHKMELEASNEGGEDGAKVLLLLSFLDNLGLGNINSKFPTLEFTNGKLTGVYQN